MFFDEWFTKQMLEQGYKRTSNEDLISRVWMTFQNGYDELSRDLFHVCYLRAEMSPEDIRMSFSVHHDEHVLFVIDVRALPLMAVPEFPKWIRILHAVYYGRVYVYEDLYERIKALHIDWTAEIRHYSPPLEIDGILFTDTDCKLRDFPGVFHIARFYDKAFWKDAHTNTDWKQEPPKHKKRAKQTYKPEYDVPEDIREAFKRYYEESMRQRQQYEQRTYNAQPNRYTPTGDKWLQQFVSAGDLTTARTLYKQLAKEWHPDLNPGKPQALETMQAINIAYAKVKDILR